DGPFASHLPMLFEPAGGPNGRLIGHVARANPHWKLALPGRPSLAIFSGPDAYVSPNWYPSKKVEGKAVPTWNYVVVQARGMLRWIDDAADLRRIVTVLTDRFEAQRPAPWQVSDAPESYIAAMLRGIVGVELVIDTLAFKQKLSQNRSTEDRDGVVAGLADDPEDAGKELRALMLAKRGAS
ncbi:MAG TPA: FMN-binding negative transcriptional regulator, partial [Beijerinckiaceae bacterium]|nr:FMN-binding negative transcriptional regulator [Beijerinckiaceae bacterium]